MASKKFYSDPMLKGMGKDQGGMPSEVHMKDYPKSPTATFGGIYDSLEDGIDAQIRKDCKGGSKAATTKY
jgi:hypothetical protein